MFANRFILRQISIKERIQNSGFSCERVSRILVGSSVLFIVALGYFCHSMFYYFLLGLAANLIQSGITDKCVVKNILQGMGFVGEKELGKTDRLKNTH